MPRPPEELELVQDQDFDFQNISITNRKFEGCSFKNCNLYHAGGMLHFEGCRFDGVKWIATGPLADALVGKPAAKTAADMVKAWNEILGIAIGKPGIDEKGNIRT